MKQDRDHEVETQSGHRRVLVRRLDRKALHRPQGPNSGINAIIGRIPADDDDEEIIALLQKLS
jgi:hypothetical protein